MPIAEQDRQKLLSLARRGVESVVTGRPQTKPDKLAGVLAEKRGCFVTLTNSGHLRGCIGTFQPQRPLGVTILDMARSAAQDPRFVWSPITPEELPELTVQVSVLSALDLTDEPEKLQPGKHGIYVVHGFQSGCFLPEVATDQGWDAEEFLNFCCAHKAGLAPDAWRDPKTKVYLFTSEKFSE